MSNQKFRPAFSAPEIQYLIDLCNLDSRPETAEMGFNIASRLKVFALKINLGITGPAFTSEPVRSLEEKLGMDMPEEKRLAAFQKWKLSPNLCTDLERKLANTYRYENNLMTKEEEEQYERV